MKLFSWDNGSLGLNFPGCMSVVDIASCYNFFSIQVVYFLYTSVLEYNYMHSNIICIVYM